MNFGERIYELRSKAGMSQGDLADRLDVSRQAVSKWENNSAVPDLDKLLKMCELFSVSLDELVKGEKLQKGKQQDKKTEITEESAPVLNSVPENRDNGKLPVRKIFAFIFFGFTMLIAVLSLCLGDIDIITLSIPFISFGLICWFCKNHTGLNCLWFFYIFFEIYSTFMTSLNFNVYAIRMAFNDIRYLFIGLAALTVNLFMIVFTVSKVKNRPIKKTLNAKTGLVVRWGLLAVFYLVTMPIAPFLVDSIVISGQHGGVLSDALQILSLAENVVPLVLFTVAVSFTVRFRKIEAS